MSSLQAVVYDEADELFMQHNNHPCFEALKKHLKEKGVAPQHCMYSATYNDDVVNKTMSIVGTFTSFNIKKESLKLKGVKNYKLTMEEQEKVQFVCKLHTNLDRAMTMVFVNRKDSATKL